MPTLQEMLSDIDVRMPNSFTSDQKIVWINEALRKIYKYMNDNDIFEFTTIQDQPTYSLPSNCTIDQIISVELTTDTTVTTSSNFTTYTFKGTNEELNGNNYFDAYNGLIGIYPIPDITGYNVKVFYRKRPFLLSSGNLGATPEINEDYQDAIKFYCLAVIAKSGNNPDVQLANNYTIEYNTVIQMMFKDLLEKKVKEPLKSRANRWW